MVDLAVLRIVLHERLPAGAPVRPVDWVRNQKIVMSTEFLLGSRQFKYLLVRHHQEVLSRMKPGGLVIEGQIVQPIFGEGGHEGSDARSIARDRRSQVAIAAVDWSKNIDPGRLG